ncbi:hypothetical protein KQX54_017778 [Cotesia glomerata]|uniref:EGF-like domain-containing protein n=2 Tax=Cotesia glomerata TaxID=32391 RepID=A0AAV7HZ47_COTGL|nr:hypothetical protein KQX54_017778 [Cotesia glomerata]
MSANYGHICDPTNEKPCGNSSLECKLTDLNNVFTCTYKVQLGQLCKVDEDCNEYISRAECSKQKKCVCKLGSIQAGKVSCFPLLGEFCEDNETCQPNNSICFDNLCQCDNGYLPNFNRICSPILLGTYCENNNDCIGIKYAECSKENYCTCKDHTVQINPSRCVATPHFICESNSQCEENKLCINYRCQCKPGFHLSPAFKCVSGHLGMNCETDNECSNLIRHSMCSAEKKCECDHFHYPIEDSVCASTINDACKNSELCTNGFTLCLDNKCHCQPNYVYNGKKCVPASKN